MTVRDAIHIFQISQKNLHRKRTTDSYRYLLEHLENHFTDSHVEAITSDHIHQFLEALTEHAPKSTRRLRYAQVKAFFNFLINEKGIPMIESLPGFDHGQSFQKSKDDEPVKSQNLPNADL